MENTRTLKTDEVPEEAIGALEEMTMEMLDEIISDFLKLISKRGLTIDRRGIDSLKTEVRSNTKLSLKISMKVDMDMVHNLEIPVRDANQTGIELFEDEE